MIATLFAVMKFVPGLLDKVLNYMIQKSNITLEGFRVGATVDMEAYKAYLQSMVEINRMKLVSNGWWGAKVIIMIAGVPASTHFAAVMLDSFSWPYIGWDVWYPVIQTHVVGSWHVVKIPAPYDSYQWAIVQSFFIVAPIMPIVSATTAWLAKK